MVYTVFAKIHALIEAESFHVHVTVPAAWCRVARRKELTPNSLRAKPITKIFADAGSITIEHLYRT